LFLCDYLFTVKLIYVNIHVASEFEKYYQEIKLC
jgi:hypothetical protein